MRNWTNVDPGFTLAALGLYHFTDHFQNSIWSGAKWHFSHALIAALKLMLSGTTLGAVHGVHQLKHGWPFTLHVPEKRTTTLYICRVWHELQKSSCLGSETVIIINFAIYDSLCVYNMHEHSSWWFQRPEKTLPPDLFHDSLSLGISIPNQVEKDEHTFQNSNNYILYVDIME
jgi:hypothetical protein